jgi:hypothetical protein
MIREAASPMRTCVERCAHEFESDLEGIFGRVVTRAECERIALKCDPCNPDFCVVSQVLKKRIGSEASQTQIGATLPVGVMLK